MHFETSCPPKTGWPRIFRDRHVTFRRQRPANDPSPEPSSLRAWCLGALSGLEQEPGLNVGLARVQTSVSENF